MYLLFAVHVSNKIFQVDINNDFCVYLYYTHVLLYIMLLYKCIDIGIIAKTLFTI